MNNFNPDWSEVWNAARAEYELAGFKFDGPGYYYTNVDTVLVIPLDRKPDYNFWNKEFSPNELFSFNFYNANDPSNIFWLINSAPVRTPPKHEDRVEEKRYALIDMSDPNQPGASCTAGKVVGVYNSESKAGEAFYDAWDCSGKQMLRIVSLEK